MKLVFIHDGPLFFDDEGNYYEFAYHELFERYSYIANEISFLMRTKRINSVQKFTPVPKDINIISVPNFKSIKLYLKNKNMAEIIIKKCVKENDYIVIRSQSSIADIAIKYIKKYDKPYIVESVGCSWDSYWNHGVLGKVIAPYMYLKTRNIIYHSKFVYYVTEKFLQSRYPSKGITVNCSNVVLGKTTEQVLQKRLDKITNFEFRKKIIVGTAAAIDTRYKGQEYVIRMIKLMTTRGYDIEYHLAGGVTGAKENTYLYDLATLLKIDDKIKFKGSLSANDMSDFYDSLDIYIQPSKQEGLPRAVIEAMSRGCPIIGTDIAGIPELINRNCLFKKGNSKQIMEALLRLLEMDLEKIARENFENAKNYEKDILQKKREVFYDKFLLVLQEYK